MVRTLRCGRSNPGSNPGHDTNFLLYFSQQTNPTPHPHPHPHPHKHFFCFYLIKGKKLLLRIFFFNFIVNFLSFFLSSSPSSIFCLCICLFLLFFSFLFPVNKNVKKKNAVRPRAAKFCKLTVQSRRGWGGERKKERPRFNSLWFPPSSSRLLRSPRARKGRRTA